MIWKNMRKNLLIFRRFVNYESPSFREEIVELVKNYLPGQWRNVNSKTIYVQKLRGGLSNWLFKISLPFLGQQVKTEPRTVLLRFHHPLSPESVFDYVSESLALMYLSERGLSPKLLGIFPGGRIEEYIDARTLSAEDLGKKKFSWAIAAKMAHIHSINVPLSRKSGAVFDLMEKWLAQAKIQSKSWIVNDLQTKKHIDFFTELDLAAEIFWLRDFLGNSGSTIVFCHNDLQGGNILAVDDAGSKESPAILFIDYEYAFYNYRGFEFANHFVEYMINYGWKEYPYFLINEDNYPSLKHQLKFIRHYMRARKKYQEKHGDEEENLSNVLTDDDPSGITEAEAKLLEEISNFRLASHLLWAIWSALRCESKIKFGYWEYCLARLKLYLKTKEEITFQERSVN